MKFFGGILALALANGALAAGHECLVKREFRQDNSNTGEVSSVKASSDTLAVPTKAGEQAHATLSLKTESGVTESYVVYVWNNGSTVTARATFGENGQLGLVLPADGQRAQAFQFTSTDTNLRSESETVFVTLECHAK